MLTLFCRTKPYIQFQKFPSCELVGLEVLLTKANQLHDHADWGRKQ